MHIKRVFLCFVLATVPVLAAAQADTRLIRVLVGFPTGGATDIVARILNEKTR